MSLNLLKWWQTIKVSWVKYTAYRLNFFLQIVGPVLVFFFIKYNLWSAIYGENPEQMIQGYNLKSMVTYHIWSMIVTMIGQGHASYNMSEDIRMGRISSYLIYPFNFWEFHTASFLSFQFLQLFISGVTIAILVAFNFVELPSTYFLFHGVLYTLFISLFWFTLQYMAGLLSFWLEETWILRVLMGIVTGFLSGYLFPLDLYPDWLVSLLQYTPFTYLTYYPIKIFMGQPSPLWIGYAMIGLWIIIGATINHLIWKKGIKLYTAAGM